jgi:FAD/FMN-containing dehydrogenase/Fe-S oxidoreductase
MVVVASPALERRLQRETAGEVMFDRFSRGRYATDASIYQMMPAGVVVPRSTDDVRASLTVAREEGMAVLARGGGTSQCGQTVNTGLVVDTSKHLNRILELDVANRRCIVEPGIVLDELNRALKPHGLWFPVDVSTASRATIGGMAGNNSCGGRSIRYGTMRDNVLSIDAILADGSEMHFGVLNGAGQNERIEQLLNLGAREADEIARRFPKVLRRVGGYNIDALTPRNEPVNLAHLLVGSEGTLAFSTAIELKLSPIVANKMMAVCHFPTFYQAMDAAQHLVRLGPQAVELVDATMIGLAREIAMFRQTVEQFVRGEPEALLLVEFGEDSDAANRAKLNDLDDTMAGLGLSWSGAGRKWGGVVRAEDSAGQNALAEMRKSGLNIMMSMKQDGKPVSFVEDCAVELPDLAEYTAGLTDIFHKHGTTGTWYAHASVGCLHVRPVLNMKQDLGAKTMRAIAEDAFDLVLKYKGSHSGEHGDGIVRSEFHEKMFGSRIVDAFRQVKASFDPGGLFNPGKIVDAPKMDDRSLFRYAPDYTVEEFTTALNWSDYPGAGGGFQGAVEMCNNNGACRKLTAGVMCPSYRVTRNERDVTRGRANALRLAISGQFGPDAFAGDDMLEAMKLCVSCKGCRRECPTGVDMARMKIEVMAARARAKGSSLHDRLVAYMPHYGPYLAKVPWLANARDAVPGLAKALEGITGFAAGRRLPAWSGSPFADAEAAGGDRPDCVLFADTFNRYFEPENLRAAITVLKAGGFEPQVATPPERARPLCCGRTFLASGLVDQATAEAKRLVAALLPFAQAGLPIIGLEPSCLLSLRDEIPALLPGAEAEVVAQYAVLFEEFAAGQSRMQELPLQKSDQCILVHGHCHQKSFGLMSDVECTLKLLPGANVGIIASGCCGMAGAFGYGKDTHETSMQMGGLDLFPAIEASDADTVLVAAGTSCRHQIADGTGRTALHPARVFANALEPHARRKAT